jgi:hypothetical protein
MVKDTAYHVGLLVTCLVLGLILVIVGTVNVNAFIGSALLGVSAYCVAYIWLLHTEPAPEEEWVEPESEWGEAAVMSDRKRIIVNGKMENIPANLQPAIEAIISYREAGELQTVSARSLHELGIASRFAANDETTAQDIMDWLIEMDVVEQKPRSAGEWVGDIKYYPPTPNGVSRQAGNGGVDRSAPPPPHLSTTTTTN